VPKAQRIDTLRALHSLRTLRLTPFFNRKVRKERKGLLDEKGMLVSGKSLL